MATLAANGGSDRIQCDKLDVAASSASSGGGGATRSPRRISCPYINQISWTPIDCPKCHIPYVTHRPNLWIHPTHNLMIIRS